MTRELDPKGIEAATVTVRDQVGDHMTDWFAARVARAAITAYLDATESDPAPVSRWLDEAPVLRSAYRTTISDGQTGDYQMKFRFPTLLALHAADNEWAALNARRCRPSPPASGAKPMVDTRIAYGARCTWWGSITDVGKRDGLPCCPSCHNMLFEMPDEATWWKGVDAYEAKGNSGYRKMIEWSRKRCFPSRGELMATWEKTNG